MHFQHDDRIVQRHLLAGADMLVLAQRHEVMWRDGSSVQMHLVRLSTQVEPDTFVRALQLEGLRWFAFDLRQVLGTKGRELEADVLRLQPRDTPGVVFFTLRCAFPTSGVFTAAVQANSCAQWWDRAASQQVAA